MSLRLRHTTVVPTGTVISAGKNLKSLGFESEPIVTVSAARTGGPRNKAAAPDRTMPRAATDQIPFRIQLLPAVGSWAVAHYRRRSGGGLKRGTRSLLNRHGSLLVGVQLAGVREAAGLGHGDRLRRTARVDVAGVEGAVVGLGGVDATLVRVLPRDGGTGRDGDLSGIELLGVDLDDGVSGLRRL